jgi:cytochrome P450
MSMALSIPAPPDLLAPEHIEDPWPGLAVLRDHYPVHWDEIMEVWLISRYADIRPINRSTEPGPPFQELLGKYMADATLFTAMEGLDHRRRRALLAPVFARNGVEGFGGRIERQARALLEPVFERERQAVAAGERERGRMDFIGEFTAPFPINVITDLLGLPAIDKDRMQEWATAWLGVEGNIWRDPTKYERGLWAKETFGEYILPIIAERRTGDGDDLISQMCRAEIDGFTLPDEEIRSIAAVTVLGGGETTDHQLSWLMEALIRHPDQQRQLAEDRSLMDKALAEGMRYCSIVQYIPHMARDMEVDGRRIEAGAQLALVLAAGNHDPRRFDRPDEFDIHRDDLDAAKAFTGSADHLGFGAGAHFCIGSHLSKAEQAIGLNVFFDNARNVRFADGFEPHAKPDAPFVRALSSLEITFDLV